MGNIRTILIEIIANGLITNDDSDEGKVRVNNISRGEYETVRTRLSRLWKQDRDVLLATGDDADPIAKASLCGNYIEDECCGIFYLGMARRKIAKEYSFQIIGQQSSDVGRPSSIELPTIKPITTTRDTDSHDYEQLETIQQSDEWNVQGYLGSTQE